MVTACTWPYFYKIMMYCSFMVFQWIVQVNIPCNPCIIIYYYNTNDKSVWSGCHCLTSHVNSKNLEILILKLSGTAGISPNRHQTSSVWIIISKWLSHTSETSRIHYETLKPWINNKPINCLSSVSDLLSHGDPL